MQTANATNGLESRQELSALFSEITPALVAVVDEDRRVLYANESMRRFLGYADANEALGRDFCECFGCARPAEDADGTARCAYCVLRDALGKNSRVETSIREVPLRNHLGQTFVFRARTRPVVVDGTNVTAVLMHDISDEKRRETLEHMFFHDLLNAASGILGLLNIVEQEVPGSEKSKDMLRTAKNCAEYLVEEIDFSRALSYAERDALELNPEPVDLNRVMEKTCGFFSMLVRRNGVLLNLEHTPGNNSIITDRTILTRILINLVKNALEASQRDETVSIKATRDKAGNALFEVHNDTFMSRETQENIFVRSFSTKGKGRGIGTYSVKLFAEEYLKGKVWFASDENSGTSFFVQIPSIAL